MKHASLNHAYRLVWNHSIGAFIAVAENVSACGKRSSRALKIVTALFVGVIGGLAQAADLNALPTGGQIIFGQASIGQTNNQLTVTQSSDKLITNWNTFDIGEQATVHFQQPNALSAALNRVASGNPSQILGKLTSNGQIYLINPSGIIFGKNAQVNLGALVASSLNLTNENFLSGNNNFVNLGGAGNILNQGDLKGKVIALIAPQTKNDGTITSKGVALAAGDKVSLDFTGDGLISIQVDQATLNALAENNGLIKADGGLVILTAQSANALYEAVVNNTGTIQANSLENKNGKIILTGPEKGSVQVTGTLDTSGKNSGGEIYVGGGWQGKDKTISQATRTYISEDAVLNASATENGDGGTIAVWSDITNKNSVTKAYGTFLANAGINGGDGGKIETSGHYLDIKNSKGSASANNGKAGEWLLDPLNVTIGEELLSGGDFTSAAGVDMWTPTEEGSRISNMDIINKLNSGTSVTVNTGGAGSQEGNIIVNSFISKMEGNGAATLTLAAGNNILINSRISSASGMLNLLFTNNGTSNGVIILKDMLSTHGGSLIFDKGVELAHTVGLTCEIDTAGGNLTFAGRINSADTTARALIISSGGGAVNFSGAVGGDNALAALTVTSTDNISINGGEITTAGAQTYNGAVTLHSDTRLTTNNSAVNFSSTINSANATARELTISSGSGSINFSGALGSIQALSALTANSTTNIAIHGGSIKTTGTQTYSGPVVLNANTMLTANNGAVNFFDTINSDNTTARELTISSGSGSINFSGVLGGLKTLSALTANSTANIAINGGAMTTTGAQSYAGPVTLNADTQLTTSNSAVSFSSTINSANTTARALEISSGSGAINFSGILGNILGLGNVTANSTGATIFSGGINSAVSLVTDAGGSTSVSGNITTRDQQTYNDSVSIQKAIKLTASSIVAANTLSASNNALTLAADALTFGGAVSGSGALILQPKTPGTPIGIAGGSSGLTLSAGYFSTQLADGFSSITVGSSTAGPITLHNATTFNDNIIFISGGAITLNGSVSAPNQTMTLTGGDQALVSGSGNITASNLLLDGAGALYNLNTASANHVGVLASTGVDSIQFKNSSHLTVGSVGAIHGVTADKNILLSASGVSADLILNKPVTTSSGVITLVAGRNFINNTATNTGIVNNAGRYLIYSANPLNSVEAMTGYQKHYAQTYVENVLPSYADSGNWFLYSVIPSPLLLSPNNVSLTYGDEISTHLVGLIDGDNNTTAKISGTPIFTSTHTVSESNHLTAGDHSLSYVSGLLSGVGYTFDNNPETATFTVNISRAPLIVSAVDVTKKYDKTNYVGKDGVTYSGFIHGENDSVLGGTLTYSGSSQGARLPGKYVITPAGLTADNYLITFNPGVLTITHDNSTPSAVSSSATSKQLSVIEKSDLNQGIQSSENFSIRPGIGSENISALINHSSPIQAQAKPVLSSVPQSLLKVNETPLTVFVVDKDNTIQSMDNISIRVNADGALLLEKTQAAAAVQQSSVPKNAVLNTEVTTSFTFVNNQFDESEVSVTVNKSGVLVMSLPVREWDPIMRNDLVAAALNAVKEKNSAARITSVIIADRVQPLQKDWHSILKNLESAHKTEGAQ